MDLASIRLSIMVANQQLLDIKLTLWVTLDIPMVAMLLICTPLSYSMVGGI
jgi:hypothetical protein